MFDMHPAKEPYGNFTLKNVHTSYGKENHFLTIMSKHTEENGGTIYLSGDVA